MINAPYSNIEKVAIFIPTLNRSHKIPSIASNILNTSRSLIDRINIYFIIESSDTKSAATIAELSESPVNVIVNQRAKGYSGAINTAFLTTTEPFFFNSADDLEFTEDCLEHALSCMSNSHIGVVGTYDLNNQWSDNSPNCLVRRQYINLLNRQRETTSVVFAENRHAWVDWELNCVAKARRAYHFCKRSKFKHNHPGWADVGLLRKNSPLYDAVYRNNYKNYLSDSLYFISKADSWRQELSLLPSITVADQFIIKLTSSKSRFIIQHIKRKIRYFLKTFLCA